MAVLQVKHFLTVSFSRAMLVSVAVTNKLEATRTTIGKQWAHTTRHAQREGDQTDTNSTACATQKQRETDKKRGGHTGGERENTAATTTTTQKHTQTKKEVEKQEQEIGVEHDMAVGH